ncbi:MAG: tRNA preQ1(34) S-adenosylmethionine ribosyltransferase-isomerase QueA [Robiginitomaculum sp.]|nr:MAG: tRNA preQ1(34) S-adenosylmethionine ribosyltransferase-isomerase QueA [Robiginitomaculum sp.]
MDVELFNFDLPEDRIALRPANPRDSAKLLQVKNGDISDHSIGDLPQLLRAGDVLVLNETRVLRACLKGVRRARAHGGGGDVRIGINLHKCLSDHEWRAFARPAKRLKDGDKIQFSETLNAVVFDKFDGGDIGLRFSVSGAALEREIEQAGEMPLPPYIARKRAVDDRDDVDYQTVFATEKGSVAAPTAGLHFTPALFKRLEANGIEIVRLTLHVGAGTFLPVSHANTDDHKMHSEWFSIDGDVAERINLAKAEGRRVIAVGTTALRALESSVGADNQLIAQNADTEIFITPGYRYKIVDGLLTNFHLPKSTLFMLVSALAGLETMQNAYNYAISEKYRFYSYGDTSLLWRGSL